MNPAAAEATTVAGAFARAAERFPDHPFLNVLPETGAAYGIPAGEITYRAMREAAAAQAQAYAEAGVGAGHRVALLLENRPAFFRHWLALNALGASIVPVNPDLRSAELEYLIAHSEAALAVGIPARQEALSQAARAGGSALPVAGPDDPPPAPRSPPPAGTEGGEAAECALLYTSGTTGRPKGCVLPNLYFLAAGRWYAGVGGLCALREGAERMLTPLPLFHMNALAYSTLATVLTGGCLAVLDRFHPGTWWESVRAHRATAVHYLGVMPPMLMKAQPSASDRDHQVRFGFGAGVDRTLHAPFEARFGFPLVEAWAMTETGAGAVVAASHEPRHVGTACFGRPAPAVETRILGEDGGEAPPGEPGELLVRAAGPDPRRGFFARYLKDEAATETAWADGWFHTGDVVRAGPDGALHFVDRRKNVIRRSGENISAVEVEAVLVQHPEVRAVAVAPVPDPVRGDEVMALVVPAGALADEEARARLAGDLVAWCLARLAYYKAPGHLAFVEALPLTSTQKIQRAELKARAAAALGTAQHVDTRGLKRRAA